MIIRFSVTAVQTEKARHDAQVLSESVSAELQRTKGELSLLQARHHEDVTSLNAKVESLQTANTKFDGGR